MNSNGLPIDGDGQQHAGREGAHAGRESAVDADQQQQWQSIRDALRGLRYGTVTIIVQDGVIIQIDRTEKRRLRRGSNDPNSRR